MKYLETKSVDPHFNLAFEEYVLTRRRQGDYLILWQNRDSVIVGRNQNAYEEVNLSYLEEMGIDLVRRQTGGGTVFHDLGNLNYSFITDWQGGENQSFSTFSKPVVSALRKIGLDAVQSGRNDILVAGKKVSGTAMRVVKDRVLHHGTLLFDSNPEKISKVLSVDPLKFSSKAIKSVKSRVGNIRDYLPKDMSLNEFWEFLLVELSGEEFAKEELSQEELTEVLNLKSERYDNRDWNYGKSPEFSFKNKKKYEGGLVEVHLSARAGVIEEIEILGDYMAIRPTEEVLEALVGVALERGELLASIEGLKFPVMDYFGGITSGEIIDTILGTEEKH